uniref:Hyp12 n=1 Tax=Moniliophthora roreri (strain MCA 2997) TaxID=1381753 RepID=F2WVK3_MONRO|nr:hyp12 [Moniliophthora roreri]ADO51595.1 hyp12 [Moniliophthora roreri]
MFKLFILSPLNKIKKVNLFQLLHKVNKIKNIITPVLSFTLFWITILAVFYLLFSDLLTLFFKLFNLLLNDSTKEIICTMADSPRTTEVKIIHNDNGWGEVIKKIFIYGVGGHRFIELVRTSAKASTRTFTVAATIGTDISSSVIQRIVNDPTYINAHWQNFSAIFKDSNSVEINVREDKNLHEIITKIIKESSSTAIGSETSSSSAAIEKGNKLLPNDFSLEEIYNKTFGSLLEYFANFLQPVQVDYSNELLANQINDLSIVLFILSILIIFLFISLIINIFILINSDKLLNFFTNKYIRAYINFNKRIIQIEVFFLSANILYSMYNLSYGIHFIATHPISFN